MTAASQVEPSKGQRDQQAVDGRARRPRPRGPMVAVPVIAVLVAAPLVLGPYPVTTMTRILAFAVLVLSVDLLTRGIRHNEARMRALDYRPALARIGVFGLAGGVPGIGGALWV
jgi:ABC-type branched-subunit amino acid transport system permease subunit